MNLNNLEMSETRVVAGETLVELGKTNEKIVVLGGDLSKSTHANKFAAAYPDRFFDFGPAEQNMVSVAAGLASSGKIPIVSTFAVFGSSRPYDQIRVGVSQSNLDVKIIVTHAGLITGQDGVSAQSIEDIAIMNALPNFNIIVPTDSVETKSAIKYAINTKGPFYIRLSRPATPIIHKNENFQFGKSELIKNGTDVTIIACGIMVIAALHAANNLEKKGISCRILNMPTIKPIDTNSILNAAKETNAIVTAEEHFINGGLSSIVAHTLSQHIPTPLECVAINQYAESGSAEELLKKYHLTDSDIEKAVEKVISRKIK
tara:strand:+ start:41969 stop:42919 length:951 start_codon:yes stop_codon:yes gene_type:complete